MGNPVSGVNRSDRCECMNLKILTNPACQTWSSFLNIKKNGRFGENLFGIKCVHSEWTDEI